jgi:hypothetical protein
VGRGCCKVETGDGELERGEESVETGVGPTDTGVDSGIAPCTAQGRGETPWMVKLAATMGLQPPHVERSGSPAQHAPPPVEAAPPTQVAHPPE